MTYLDYNATTPTAPEVIDAMQPYWRDSYANASSLHQLGRQARTAIEIAQEQVATAVGAKPSEVIFTSSGTESNNAIIKGIAKMALNKTIAVGGTEHPCVLCSARSLQGDFAVEFLAVDDNGIIEASDLDDVLTRDCGLVSVMLANNETGVIQDIAAITQKVKNKGGLMHTDAAQALGKIPFSFAHLAVDAMTISGHKCYGPKGIAALIVKESVQWAPLLEGGGHQGGMRSGTENVAGIVGFGVACQLATSVVLAQMQIVEQWRDSLIAELSNLGASIFGGQVQRLPNTCYFGFPNISGESMVTMLDQNGFAVTSGAACSSMKDSPSHVLLAMGYDEAIAHSAVRVTLGYDTTAEEVNRFSQTVKQLVSNFQSMGF